MSTPGLHTIWELVAEGAATLPEPFSRAALINWVSARRPEVGVSSIAAHPIGHRQRRAAAVGPRAAAAPHRPRAVRPAPRGASGRVRRRRTAAGPGRLLRLDGGRARAGRARLFTSPGFARARDAAVRARLPWFVLSAGHGLLDAEDVVGPSDAQIGDQSSGYRTAWGEWVVAQLAERVRLDGVVVEVHGGVDFAQPLRGPLARRGAALEIPLPGTWQEPDDDPQDGHPVRTALGKLRDLVGRHASAS